MIESTNTTMLMEKIKFNRFDIIVNTEYPNLAFLIIDPDYDMDMGANFAHQMGIAEPYDDVARMYFILHSDHESGNASAHTTHLVASTLADAYYSLSAGLNALAGPLHGLANQEVLGWLQGVMKKMGGIEPTEEDMKKFVWDTLNSGNVIPGFGHAVFI